MNILKNLIATSIIASVAVSVTAQSDELMDIIHPESADLFHYEGGIKSSDQEGIFSLNDDYNSVNTWSYEFEEYVDQADYSPVKGVDNPALVNRYIENNPTASGHQSEPVFKWDSNYDGYMVY